MVKKDRGGPKKVWIGCVKEYMLKGVDSDMTADTNVQKSSTQIVPTMHKG